MKTYARAIPVLVLGALSGLTPLLIFPPCRGGHGDIEMPCHHTAGMASAIGFAVMAGAAVALLSKPPFAKGIIFMAGLTALLAPAASHGMIGLCRMEAMQCRTGLGPAIDVLAAVTAVAVAWVFFWPVRNKPGADAGNTP